MMLERVRGRAVALLFVLTVAADAAGASGESGARGVFYMSAGRLGAVAAVLIGLAGVVSGVRTLRSAGRVGSGERRRAFSVALSAGPIAVAVGGFVAATAPGGVGTGNGFGGAVLGIVAGLSAAVLGIIALIRARRS